MKLDFVHGTVRDTISWSCSLQCICSLLYVIYIALQGSIIIMIICILINYGIPMIYSIRQLLLYRSSYSELLLYKMNYANIYLACLLLFGVIFGFIFFKNDNIIIYNMIIMFLTGWIYIISSVLSIILYSRPEYEEIHSDDIDA